MGGKDKDKGKDKEGRVSEEKGKDKDKDKDKDKEKGKGKDSFGQPTPEQLTEAFDKIAKACGVDAVISQEEADKMQDLHDAQLAEKGKGKGDEKAGKGEAA